MLACFRSGVYLSPGRLFYSTVLRSTLLHPNLPYSILLCSTLLLSHSTLLCSALHALLYFNPTLPYSILLCCSTLLLSHSTLLCFTTLYHTLLCYTLLCSTRLYPTLLCSLLFYFLSVLSYSSLFFLFCFWLPSAFVCKVAGSIPGRSCGGKKLFLHAQLSVLALISVSVSQPCYRSNT